MVRIPLVMRVIFNTDGRIVPFSFVWPDNGKTYPVSRVYDVRPFSVSDPTSFVYACSSLNRIIYLLIENNRWYMLKEYEPSESTQLYIKNNRLLFNDLQKRTLAELFCEIYNKNDLSAGGNYDFCNIEVVRPLLKNFHRFKGFSEDDISVKFVSDYFRDRRYEVLDKVYAKDRTLTAGALSSLTRFSFNMCNKFMMRKLHVPMERIN